MRGTSRTRSAARRVARVALVSAAAAVVSGVLTTGVPRVAAAQTDDVPTAIRERIDEYRSVWNSHDASALAAFFTEDADMVMGNLAAAHGREEIRDSWRDYFERQEPQRQLTLDVSPVGVIAADVVVVDVATTTGGYDAGGRELAARKFRGTWLLRRQDGRWLIAAMRGLPDEQDRVVLNTSPEATEALRPRIRAFVDAYEDAFNRHDASAVSGFFRDDAELIVRDGPVTRGRQAIHEWWRDYFSQPRPYRAILIIDEIRMITPEVALLNFVATGAFSQSEDPSPPVRYARATWVISREAGEWGIAALWVLPSLDDRIIRGGKADRFP